MAGGCFRHPFQQSPTLAPDCFKPFFGSTSSVPKMDFSPSTWRIIAYGTYRTALPMGLRPRLPIHRLPLSSGVYALFNQTQASGYERTTIAALPCPSSSTLDRARFHEETLAILEKFRKIGWFAPNHKPKRNKVIRGSGIRT
jgi:hypothetical protein